MENSRRNFIKTAAASSAMIAVGGIGYGFSTKSYSHIIGANDRVSVGVMGLNSRGAWHCQKFSQMKGVEVAYICDVEDGAIKKGLTAMKDASRQPIVEKDIRNLVKKSDLDAIIIAAPDHWHAPAALMALQNGKSAYVEKPCSHNPHESEILIQAQAKYGKVIQVGSQRRSFPTLIEAVKQVRAGLLGNVYMAKSWYTNARKPIGVGKIIPVPSTLDWNLWQGPAPRKEYKDNLVHYNWHWLWNWGTGEACNNGNHELDCCRWFLGVDIPTKVTSAGGRYAAKDDWETPDTQIASFEFADQKVITWEGRSCQNYPIEGSARGFIIYGDKGTLVNIGGEDYKIYDTVNKLVNEIKSERIADANNTVSASGDADLYHFNNFIESIRGNEKPNASIQSAHESVLLCHLANISQRVGSSLTCDPKNGHIIGNKDAEKLWSRSYEKGWEMKL